MPSKECSKEFSDAVLGCYLSIYSETLEKTEKLFHVAGRNAKTAAQNFARQIAAIGDCHADAIKVYLRLSHFSIHGLEKAAVHMPPPLLRALHYSHR
jgi:hypothetical protein